MTHDDQHHAHGIAFAQLDLEPGERFQSLRRLLELTGMGLNLLRLEPGQRGRIHAHQHQEEVYLVLEGRLTLIVEGAEHRLDRHHLVRVAPQTRRQLANLDAEPLRILAMGAAGAYPGRDGRAWSSWDEPYDAGRPPADVPLP